MFLKENKKCTKRSTHLMRNITEDCTEFSGGKNETVV